MNYTEKITLEQALDLQKKIEKGEIPDMSACYRIDNRDIPVYSILDEGDLNTYNGGYYYITRSDYATYILGNKPLPDGYGYPSKDLSIGIYDELPYYFNFNADDWSKNLSFDSNYTTVKKWYQICFRLTDLARVEAEADKPFAEKYKETLAEPKPSMPANFTYQNDEWLKEANKLAVEHDELKAKYIELEEQHNTLIKHLQEATASADAKQDIINNLEDKNKKLKFRLDDLHGYSPKDWKIAELEMQVDFNKDMRKMHLENVSDLHDFYHKIIWNLFEQLEK